jgi:hypothetical protein
MACLVIACLVMAGLVMAGQGSGQETHDNTDAESRLAQDLIKSAFVSSHDGWSVDEVLLHDERRNNFLKAVRSASPASTEKAALQSLLHWRKSGKLEVPTSRRAPSVDDRDTAELEERLHAAELAARAIADRRGVHVDQILVDPVVRDEFDQLARSLDERSSTYDLRKAALRLRKERKLTPELTLRVADWKRDIRSSTLSELRKELSTLPNTPAVYLFSDSTGYLYIGQTSRLRDRITRHLADSDRQALAQYLEKQAHGPIRVELHCFGEASPALDQRVREAYESELIRSRKPRLNLAP